MNDTAPDISMSAITIRQPWAALISCGAKRYESRTWAPPARLIKQRVAIHAGRAQPPRDLLTDEITAIVSELGLQRHHWSNLHMGSVVCTAVIHGAYKVAQFDQRLGLISIANTLSGSTRLDAIQLRGADKHFADHRVGLWLWALGDVRSIDPPRPATGKQGIWRWHVDRPI